MNIIEKLTKDLTTARTEGNQARIAEITADLASLQGTLNSALGVPSDTKRLEAIEGVVAKMTMGMQALEPHIERLLKLEPAAAKAVEEFGVMKARSVEATGVAKEKLAEVLGKDGVTVLPANESSPIRVVVGSDKAGIGAILALRAAKDVELCHALGLPQELALGRHLRAANREYEQLRRDGVIELPPDTRGEWKWYHVAAGVVCCVLLGAGGAILVQKTFMGSVSDVRVRKAA